MRRLDPAPPATATAVATYGGDQALADARVRERAERFAPPPSQGGTKRASVTAPHTATISTCRVGSWRFTSRFTSMQNLDRIHTITSGSHPCRNGWTFHIWSHIHAESGSDGCHICKIHVKFSARAARSLAMQIRKSHPESHPCKIQRTQVTSITSESHPRVTSGQNSEASHIRVVTSAITSGQNPVTSRGPPYRGPPPLASTQLLPLDDDDCSSPVSSWAHETGRGAALGRTAHAAINSKVAAGMAPRVP